MSCPEDDSSWNINSELRLYDDQTRPEVINHYKKMRSKQTVEHVKRLRRKYQIPSSGMTIRCALKSLLNFVDVSDPDVDLPNLVHLYQTAEGIRHDGHPEWMQLIGLVHDLGKCIYLRGSDSDGTSVNQQWSIVGDTFVVGHPLPDSLVFPEFNRLNPDVSLSIYQPGCGLDSCYVSYGHDEYLYQVLRETGLDPRGLAMIRYHSLYAWHKHGAYTELEDDHDREMKPWVQLFNKYDLYTKRNINYTDKEIAELETYYGNLIDKYLPGAYLF